MRLRRLIPLACAVAGALYPTLPTTAASAFKHPSPSGRCRVSIQTPVRITAGESATIFGRLACQGRGRASAADRVVRLFRHVPGTPGFTLIQSTTTDTQGFYQLPLAAGVVETDSVWHVRSHGAESANRVIRVAAQVTLVGPPEGTQILTGEANKVTFTGTVTPADVGARVILQRQNALTGNEWRRIDSGVVEATGAFSIVHTFLVPGDANLRVLVRSQGRNLRGESNVLSYEISQAQNPELTITSSADPILYGQSATISGTLPGGADQPVTLLARTVHQQGFAPVAQATTNGSGAYTFPAQTPVNSTFYKVQGGGKSSAVLYEGVRYVLSAQVSATSVLQGQTLTFTGSVAPSRPGHVIYLERQNASGQGFHVVQLGLLSQESTFSVAYQVYATGTDVFRVYIPGGPDNGGAASQPFTIQVGAAPAATLTPERPGNTSSPSEGTTSPSEGEKEGEAGNGESEREPPHRGHRRR
jgi:hypothetical protein